MKKKFLILSVVIGGLSLVSPLPVFSEIFNQEQQPTENIKENDVWYRDVGDGIDTFIHENGQWRPSTSSSARREAARNTYLKEVIDPNRKEIETALELKKSYIDQADKNPDTFKDYADEEIEHVLIMDYYPPKMVRIPKVTIPEFIEYPELFYITPELPMMLEIIKDPENSDTSTTESTTDSTETTESSSSNESSVSNGSSMTDNDFSAEPTDKLASETTPSSDNLVKATQTVATILNVSNQTVPVEVGKTLNRQNLLDLITYDGNPEDLKIDIKSHYVYVTPNAEVYHYDLHELLSKTTVSRVTVMTEAEALEKGLRVSTENNDKNIDTIDCSLPGEYTVTYSDGNLTKTITLSIPKSESTVPSVGSSSSSSSTNNSNRKESYPSSSVVKPTSTKTYPKTGEAGNYLSLLGAIISLNSAIVLFKKSKG